MLHIPTQQNITKTLKKTTTKTCKASSLPHKIKYKTSRNFSHSQKKKTRTHLHFLNLCPNKKEKKDAKDGRVSAFNCAKKRENRKVFYQLEKNKNMTTLTNTNKQKQT